MILITLLLLIFLVFFFISPYIIDYYKNQITNPNLAIISSRINKLHSTLLICDLHADSLLWNRNILKRNNYGHIDVPRLIQGNVSLQVFSVVTAFPLGLDLDYNNNAADLITVFAIAQRWPKNTWFSKYERAIYQSKKLYKFAEKSDRKLNIIQSKSDLSSYVELRRSKKGITAGLLALEGAQVLEGNINNIYKLFDEGFRMMSPTHFSDTEIGGSAHSANKGGLTEFGKECIHIMEDLGIIVDLAHASNDTINDVLNIATKPLIVSHTGVKGICDNRRNITDSQIRKISLLNGVIGIGYFEGAICGKRIDSVVDSIHYIVTLTGIEHVALGSDFDGAISAPFDVSRLSELTQALSDKGYTDDEIAMIMGGNAYRIFSELLPE